jgi:hypothetical protein
LVADVTYRKARESYELAITLAAQVTPDANGRFPEMPEHRRQQYLDVANLWASIAQAHATLSQRDAITRQCATISRALGAMGLIGQGEAKLRAGNDDPDAPYELEDAGE